MGQRIHPEQIHRERIHPEQIHRERIHPEQIHRERMKQIGQRMKRTCPEGLPRRIKRIN